MNIPMKIMIAKICAAVIKYLRCGQCRFVIKSAYINKLYHILQFFSSGFDFFYF